MPIVNVKQVSHVALKTKDVERQVDFYTQMVGLGETERDSAGRVYLRCNSNHHSVVLIPSIETGVALWQGDVVTLHHFVFEVRDFSHLARQADHLAQYGYSLIYGTGRHGPGHNQFIYFRDPERYLVEYTCDVQQIWDDATYEPKVWSSKERWSNLWGSPKPADF